VYNYICNKGIIIRDRFAHGQIAGIDCPLAVFLMTSYLNHHGLGLCWYDTLCRPYISEFRALFRCTIAGSRILEDGYSHLYCEVRWSSAYGSGRVDKHRMTF